MMKITTYIAINNRKSQITSHQLVFQQNTEWLHCSIHYTTKSLQKAEVLWTWSFR